MKFFEKVTNCKFSRKIIGCEINYVTVIWSLVFLLGVKVIHLMERTHLFWVGGLVSDGEMFVTIYIAAKTWGQR
jgi:hypothetical protein